MSCTSWFILVQHVAVSSGSGENDLEKMSSILEAVPQVKFICLDVANGYSEHFVEFVKLVRARFPEHTIMVGMVEPSLDVEAKRELFGVSGGAILFRAFGAFLLEDLLRIIRKRTGTSFGRSEHWLSIKNKIQINTIGCWLLMSVKYRQM